MRIDPGPGAPGVDGAMIGAEAFELAADVTTVSAVSPPTAVLHSASYTKLSATSYLVLTVSTSLTNDTATKRPARPCRFRSKRIKGRHGAICRSRLFRGLE